MGLVSHHHMIQKLAPEGADHALRVWILPRRLWSNDDCFDAHVPHPLLKMRSVDCVAIA
jgi:hypothetical protein